MTLQELYQAIDGDYEDVLGRMMRSEKMVQKFVLKFLNDQSYETLVRSMEEEKYEEAFRAAHTIKGMCQNLSFTVLQESSSQLTEALRNGMSPQAPELYGRVLEDYARTTGAIQVYKQGL